MKLTAMPEGQAPQPLFEKQQIPLMTAAEFCFRFGYSMKTIYDWRYRPKKNKVPPNLVVKIRGKLFVRPDVFTSLTPQ